MEFFELTVEAPVADLTYEAAVFDFGHIQAAPVADEEIVIAKPVEYGEEAQLTGTDLAMKIRELMGSDLPLDEFLTKYGLDLDTLQLTADFLNA